MTEAFAWYIWGCTALAVVLVALIVAYRVVYEIRIRRAMQEDDLDTYAFKRQVDLLKFRTQTRRDRLHRMRQLRHELGDEGLHHRGRDVQEWRQ